MAKGKKNKSLRRVLAREGSDILKSAGKEQPSIAHLGLYRPPKWYRE